MRIQPKSAETLRTYEQGSEQTRSSNLWIGSVCILLLLCICFSALTSVSGIRSQGCLCLVKLFVLPIAAMSPCVYLSVCQLQPCLCVYLCLLSTAVDNGRLECQLDLTSTGTDFLEVLDNLHAVLVGNLAKDNVLAIQPGSDDGGDEELGAVGVGTCVGHGQETRSGVLHLEVLVCEFLAVDGLATSAIATSEVSTLQHELRNDAVELATLVSEALLASAESTEVLGSLWDYIVIEVEVDTTPLGRRNSTTGSFSISSSFVKSSVGVFDVEPGFDGHVGG